MRDYEARCLLLEAELEEARERISILEDALGVTSEVPLSFGLSSSEARVVGVILKRQMASKEAVMIGMYGSRSDSADTPDPKIVGVMVCKIRKKLQTFGLEIETVWGQGWMMSAEHKQVIRRFIEQERGSTD